MKHLVITEGYDYIPIKESGVECLTHIEADELNEYVLSKELDTDNIIISRSEVRFINYVGYIRLSSCSIEILPKVHGNNLEHSRRVLLNLLNCTGFIKINESEISELSLLRENLLEIIGYLFTKRLTKEIKKGLYQSYVVENEHLHRIRGKIDVKKQIRNNVSKSTTVACEFDEFKTDNPLNQIFKLAMTKLLRNVQYNETQKLLLHSIVSFDEVSSRSISSHQLENINFNRNNQRFYDSYLLARLILSGSSSTFQSGLTKNLSILFKMNELFEEYIAYLTKKVTFDVTVKDRRYRLLVNEKTGYKNFLLEPDLFINKNSDKQIIIDTKWKRYDPSSSSHGVQRNDLYQMYAYLTRYERVNTVILVYPYDFNEKFKSGECLNTWHLDGNSNKKIKCYTINYENEKEALEEIKAITHLK
ncbi:McrC family protein [Priestia flexa]|uniref:McrC family protein n=1 Tax=Priestia flexa TaxID=86664 RepID=UPI00099DADE3|nr:McrC family protein [Priestia flexa]AQX53084.1 hypothetical protein BC359_01440 [Priestia flexa]